MMCGEVVRDGVDEIWGGCFGGGFVFAPSSSAKIMAIG